MSGDAQLNIKKPSVLSYWIFAGSVAIFGLISWGARGVGPWNWISIGVFAVSAAIALVFRRANQSKSDWRKNLLRLGLFGMGAGATGFVIRFFFALGVVHVENNSPFDVRLTLDGNEWLTVPAKSQTKTKLAKGDYAIAVFLKGGPIKLDEHRIEVAGHGNYLLNVLGSQTYFLGEAVYGALDSPPPKVIQEKWFEFGSVDYLFQDPPEVVKLPGGPATRSKRTYLTRGLPPVFKGREKKD
jgi:hypothetical protein